ncbi:MAG: hypothetical protein QXQ57_04530 [Sulfolobales archaeon]
MLFEELQLLASSGNAKLFGMKFGDRLDVLAVISYNPHPFPGDCKVEIIAHPNLLASIYASRIMEYCQQRCSRPYMVVPSKPVGFSYFLRIMGFDLHRGFVRMRIDLEGFMPVVFRELIDRLSSLGFVSKNYQPLKI